MVRTFTEGFGEAGVLVMDNSFLLRRFWDVAVHDDMNVISRSLVVPAIWRRKVMKMFVVVVVEDHCLFGKRLSE